MRKNKGIPPHLKPANRHITIVPHVQQNETNTGVLLPENFKPEEDRYISATVVDVAADCAAHFQNLRRGTFSTRTVVVDRTMIEEIKLKDKTFHLILENYVVGFLRAPNED